MAYTRIFLSLENEASGFDFNGKNPAGRCIIENRDGMGKFSLWTQNLKPQIRYSVFMIFSDGGQYAGISMGNLNVDEKGKNEIRKDFAPEVLGGFILDDLIGVAVISSESLGGTGVVAPLCGYHNRPVSWRGSFYVAKEKKEEIKKEVKIEVKEEIKTEVETEIEITEEVVVKEELAEEEKVEIEIKEEITEEVEVKEEITEEEKIEIEVKEEIKIEAEVEAEIKTQPVRQSAPKARKPKSVKKSILPEEVETCEPSEEKTCPRTENVLAMETIFNSKTHIKPFENFPRETTWVQLTISDAVPLPYNRPLLLEEPFVRAAYTNYDHLLLGITTDGKEYIIGVPCEYNPQERHHAKRLGFSEFKTNENEPAKRGDKGYWLMYLDM